ncbi:hypothetical protein JTB14_010292 [Gonioctena quinquepunctata]|nr:hypothetical protein JTB14_010292 [Gonioctena quinquepunctata]
MSVDSSHHEEKDGDETSQGNEDTLDGETEPIEERRYNLRDRKTREFPDFVAYSVFSNDIDEPFTVDVALSSEYSDKWVFKVERDIETRAMEESQRKKMLMLALNKQTKERFETINDKVPNISTSNNDPDTFQVMIMIASMVHAIIKRCQTKKF